MSTETLLIKVPNWKHPKCPFLGEWMKRGTDSKEHYLAAARDELLV